MRPPEQQRGQGIKVGRSTTPPAEEDDPVRRRGFLQFAALPGSVLAWPNPATAAEVDPAQVLTGRLGDVLLGPVSYGEPAPVGVLVEALAVARRESPPAATFRWHPDRRAGHHDRAQTLTLAAAAHLDVAGPHPAPQHLAIHGTLHLSAAYAAARAGDRERAADLLAEAEATANRLADDPDRHRALVANLVSHKVSAAYVLGDAGAALAHAQSLPLAAIPTIERRARLLVDAAQAWAQWDKPDRAYATLLARTGLPCTRRRLTTTAIRQAKAAVFIARSQSRVGHPPATVRHILPSI